MNSGLALPLQQTQLHASALRLLGQHVRTIEAANAAPVVAVKQFGQLMTSRGPIWHAGTCPQRQAHVLGGSRLRIINADQADDQVLATAGYRQLMTPAYLAELDLNGTPADRIAAMKQKWRNAWRRAPTICITEQRFDPNMHRWILKADAAQQRTKRFRGLPHALLSAYARSDPQAVRVLVAQDTNAPVAAMIFVLHQPVATYHIGWTSTKGRHLRAHHQIITHAANMFAERGFQKLDLGQVDTVNAAGLARFKIGCGAKVRPLGGTWLRLPGR